MAGDGINFLVWKLSGTERAVGIFALETLDLAPMEFHKPSQHQRWRSAEKIGGQIL
jgi:hypothetical protein